MHWRRRLLKESRLYLILGGRKSYLEAARLLCGVPEIKIVQLRDKAKSPSRVLKTARLLRRMFAPVKKLLIINDYPDVALGSQADGVHLGQNDLPVKEARMILGPDKLIGVSCHNLAQAQKAQKDGADYIGIGPVYPTPTKPGAAPIGLNAAAKLKGRIKIPYFAIGNIQPANINAVRSAGIRRVAVCRAVLKSAYPPQAAKYLDRELKK